jgi:hypothetical protein
VRKLVSRLEALDSRLGSHALACSSGLRPALAALQSRRALAAAAHAAAREAKEAQGLVLEGELGRRQRVLRRLGYLDEVSAPASTGLAVPFSSYALVHHRSLPAQTVVAASALCWLACAVAWHAVPF